MQTKRYFISGRVQGVGFRNYTQKKARQVGVVGWVRNLDDGRVEALATGTTEQLSHFEVFVHRGPMLASVKDVDVIEENLDNELTDFEFRR